MLLSASPSRRVAVALIAVGVGVATLAWHFGFGREFAGSSGGTPSPSVSGPPSPASTGGFAALQGDLEDSSKQLTSLVTACLETGVHSIAAETAPGVLANDPAWLRLPRNRRPFLALVKRNPTYFDPQELFRNTSLNPRDIHVHPTERAMLRSALDALKPSRVRFFQAKTQIFANAVAENSDRARRTKLRAPIVTVNSPGREAPIAAYRIETEAMAAEGIHFATVRDGVVFGLAKQDLAGCSALIDMERFAHLEFGSALVEWFRAHGTLDEHEARTLLTALYQE